MTAAPPLVDTKTNTSGQGTDANGCDSSSDLGETPAHGGDISITSRVKRIRMFRPAETRLDDVMREQPSKESLSIAKGAGLWQSDGFF